MYLTVNSGWSRKTMLLYKFVVTSEASVDTTGPDASRSAEAGICSAFQPSLTSCG